MGIDVLQSTLSEKETDPLKINMPDKKQFRLDEVNTNAYFLDVKKIISNNLDKSQLHRIDILTFVTR